MVQQGMQLPDSLHQVLPLAGGLLLETGGTEVGARRKLQGLFAEEASQRVGQPELSRVDDVVQSGTGKVSQEDGLGVGTGFQPFQRVKQGMMAVACEQSRHGRDIHQEVGLHHHQPPLVHQVQLHALVEHRPQIVQRGSPTLLQVKHRLTVTAFCPHVAVVPTRYRIAQTLA